MVFSSWALAGPKFGLSRPIGRLHTFLRILGWARSRVGPDPVLLEKLSLFLQKSLAVPQASSPVRVDAKTRREAATILAAQEQLCLMFKDITRPVVSDGRLTEHIKPAVSMHFIIKSRQSIYIDTFELWHPLVDDEGLVQAMRWILQTWDLESVLEDAKPPHHPRITVICPLSLHISTVLVNT